jgi:hypothetical protein
MRQLFPRSQNKEDGIIPVSLKLICREPVRQGTEVIAEYRV